MKLSKKAKTVLLIVTPIPLLIGGWIGYRLIAGKPIIPNFHKKLDEAKAEAERLKLELEAKANNVPYTPKSTESFPLVTGMEGDKIKALQTALNNKFAKSISPVAGYLGTKTETALKEIGYTLPLSEVDYNNVIAGKKKESVIAVSFKKGDVVIASKDMNSYGSTQMIYPIFHKKGDKIGTFIQFADNNALAIVKTDLGQQRYVRIESIKKV